MKPTDELIDDYLLGVLSAADKAEFEGLLKSDASARERLAEARLLLEMLDASAPEVPTQRMWNGIRARISAPAPQKASALSRLGDWLAGPRLRLSLAGALTVFFVVIGLRHMRQPEAPAEMPQEKDAAALPVQAPTAAKASRAVATVAKRKEARPAVMAAAGAAAAPSAQAAPPMMAAAPKKAAAHEPTEVEKALSEQDLDGVIATMLRQRQAASLAAAPQGSMGNGVQTVAFGSAAAPSLAGSASMDRMSEASAYDSNPALPPAQSRVDANGFWDFHEAALALNRRDWLTATRELQAASSAAPEAAERSFARSTLQLLSAGGQPAVAMAALAESKELNVQSAARWQVFVDNHVARYFGGVVAHMPGLRSEGDELLLDMAFDRASFSPGTKFVKLVEDEGVAGKVKDSQGEIVNATEFRAPHGADYLLRANELRLK